MVVVPVVVATVVTALARVVVVMMVVPVVVAIVVAVLARVVVVLLLVMKALVAKKYN